MNENEVSLASEAILKVLRKKAVEEDERTLESFRRQYERPIAQLNRELRACCSLEGDLLIRARRHGLRRVSRMLVGIKNRVGRYTEPQHLRESAIQIPTLEFIKNELRLLEKDGMFEEVEFRPDEYDCGTIWARIPGDVILRNSEVEVNLGVWRICMNIHRIPGGNVGRGNAMHSIPDDPRPAVGATDTYHPHIRADSICTGEHGGQLSSAVTQGRIFDAFMILRGITTTYNAESPFRPLEDWSSPRVRCSQCDRQVRQSGIRQCVVDGCERSGCDCMSTCRVCRGRVCNEHRVSCAACGNATCIACTKYRCMNCGSWFCTEHDGLGPECPACSGSASLCELVRQGPGTGHRVQQEPEAEEIFGDATRRPDTGGVRGFLAD